MNITNVERQHLIFALLPIVSRQRRERNWCDECEELLVKLTKKANFEYYTLDELESLEDKRKEEL